MAIVFVILLVILLVLFCAFRLMSLGWAGFTEAQQNHVFARLAQSFGGRLVTGPAWQNHSLHFPYREGWVSLAYVQAKGTLGSYWTYVAMDWPDPSTACEIRPQSSRGGMPSLFGTSKVLLDEPPFDADYYLAASHRWQLVNLLTPGVRDRLHELFWLRTSPRFSRQSIYLRITGGQLFIAKPGMVTSEEVLRELLELALGFYNEALLTCVAGIEFVGTKENPESVESLGDETHCLVCGEPLAGHIVYCRSCQTPHHLDCWNYFGGCGTYGCGQKRFVPRPLRAAP
jgi:hypothetical protein